MSQKSHYEHVLHTFTIHQIKIILFNCWLFVVVVVRSFILLFSIGYQSVIHFDFNLNPTRINDMRYTTYVQHVLCQMAGAHIHKINHKIKTILTSFCHIKAKWNWTIILINCKWSCCIYSRKTSSNSCLFQCCFFLFFFFKENSNLHFSHWWCWCDYNNK